MAQWTVLEPFEGKYQRLLMNQGFCVFDYAVFPSPEQAGVVIQIAENPDPETIRWFPDLRRGMLTGCVKSREVGRCWTGVRIVVKLVYAHAIDTTSEVCRRNGFHFVMEEMPSHGISVGDQRATPPSSSN